MKVYCFKCKKYVDAVLVNDRVILKCGHERKAKMVLFTVHLPQYQIRQMDLLIKLGRYTNRSELVRTAVRELLLEEFKGIERERELIKFFRGRK